MREGDSRVQVHRFYREEIIARTAVNYEREEGCGDEPQAILDFQVLCEVSANHITYSESARMATLSKSSYNQYNRAFKMQGKQNILF